MGIQLSFSKLFMLSAVLAIGTISSSIGTTYATASNSTTASNFTTASNSTTATSSNLTTDVFVDTNFGGNSTTINENIPLLEDPFQDAVSSMNITEAGNQRQRVHDRNLRAQKLFR